MPEESGPRQDILKELIKRLEWVASGIGEDYQAKLAVEKRIHEGLITAFAIAEVFKQEVYRDAKADTDN